jgi:pimeloyl-ACP methyl ester carboxylesterase
MKKIIIASMLLLILINNSIAQQKLASSNDKSTTVPAIIKVEQQFDSAIFFQSFKSKFAKVNGINMHYVVGGKGKEVIVLLHGWPESWYAWRKIMPALALEYTVIAPDLRGFGLTDKPLIGYDKKNLAKDVYELVHQLGYKNISLMSYDQGGSVAYAYAGEYANEIKKFIIFEVGGFSGLGLEKLMDITHGGLWHFGFFCSPKYPEMLIRGKEKEFFKSFAFTDFVKIPEAISEYDINHYVKTLSAPDGLNGIFEYYRTYTDDVKDDKRYAQKKLTMPILAMDGLLGGLTILSMKELANNVSGEVIAGAGHWLQEEKPNELLKQLLPFLKK